VDRLFARALGYQAKLRRIDAQTGQQRRQVSLGNARQVEGAYTQLETFLNAASISQAAVKSSREFNRALVPNFVKHADGNVNNLTDLTGSQGGVARIQNHRAKVGFINRKQSRQGFYADWLALAAAVFQKDSTRRAMSAEMQYVRTMFEQRFFEVLGCDRKMRN
jgi:hypothetical protein